MPEEHIFNLEQENNYGSFKDAICINANRIYDSCSDKDCIENLEIHFSDTFQPLINRAINIKMKDIDIVYVSLEVEHVPFNKGFYSVDIRFYFKVSLSVTEPSMCNTTLVDGLASFSKKVILYGSESSIKTFSSYTKITEQHKNYNYIQNQKLPIAKIQVSKPLVLSIDLVNIGNNHYLPQEKQFTIPKCIEDLFDGEFGYSAPEKIVYITVGLFSIIQLERETQIMVPIYDLCIPNKDFTRQTDNPSELFKKIKFPINEFFPPEIDENPEY